MKKLWSKLDVIRNTLLSRIIPYIERELTESECVAIDLIIEKFSKNILDEAFAVENVGQHLSAGLDTRAILSVLLYNNIKPVCYTYKRDNDVEVASKICRKYKLKHVILDVKSNHECFYSSFREYGKSDIVFSGLMMSEYINFYNAPFEAGDVKTTFYLHIPAIYNLNDKVRLPIIDAEILAILNREVPMFYRRYKRIQKLIINNFIPDLSKVIV